MPHKWQYYHDIGFVYYWHLRDYQTAALWFQRAAEQPNAPNWLHAAGRLDAGARAATATAARFLWQQIAKSEEAWLRRKRRTRAAAAAGARSDRPAREPGATGFRRRPASATRGPLLIATTGALKVSRSIRRARRYELDPATGRVQRVRESPLYPMPEEPRRLQ